jgi:N-acetylmuramoyl-L-alanine amidase CwlA
MHTNSATELARMVVSKLVAEVACALVLLLKHTKINGKKNQLSYSINVDTMQKPRIEQECCTN